MSSYYGDPRELPAAKDWPEKEPTINPIRWDDFKINKETVEAVRNVPSMTDEAIRATERKAMEAMEDMKRRMAEELYNSWTDRNPEPEPKCVDEWEKVNEIQNLNVAHPEDTANKLYVTDADADGWNFSNILQPSCVDINNGPDRLVHINLSDGTIEFGENYTFDEASEIFWTSLGHDSPQALKKEIEELKSRLAAYGEVDAINKEDPNVAYERAMKLVD